MLHEFNRTRPHNRPGRTWALGLLGAALLLIGCESQADKDQKAADATYREKLAKAQVIFAERCKKAGVVIHRTVKDVEGIELTKVRQPVPLGGKEYFDPMWAEAAMAGESRGDRYINQFLMAEFIDKLNPDRRGSLGSPVEPAGERGIRKLGYRFVEVIGSSDGSRMRAEIEPHPPNTNLWLKAPKLTPIRTSATRYALDYEDILNPDDRPYWVAGTVLKVVDKQNGEVIAQLTRYVWDPGFGVSTTGRWPWQHAANSGPSQVCPSELGVVQQISRAFVDTVLIPRQGD